MYKTISLTIACILVFASVASCETLTWDAPTDCQDTYYVVSRLDAQGNESVDSNEVMVAAQDCNYRVKWGTVAGNHPNSKDVGNVLIYETDDLINTTLSVE